MKLVKRLFGLVALLLGAVGLAASLGAIAGTWIVRDRIQTEFPEVLTSVDSSLSLVDENLKQAKPAIAKARASVKTFKTSAETLKSKIEQQPHEVDLTALNVLDTEVTDRFESAQDVVETNEATATTVANTLGLVDDVPYLELDEYGPDGALLTNLRAAGDRLSEIGDLLKESKKLVAALRKDPMVTADRLNAVIEISTRIDQKLAEADELVVKFDETTAKASADVSKLKSNLPKWLEWSAIAATVLFGWLALAQFSLMIVGRHLLRA